MTDPNDPTTYSDEELRKITLEAVADLQEASANQHESGWHEACFTAVVTLAREVRRRNIDLLEKKK